ncbi:hypothetical protein KJ766_02160 [Patescibacteria group bacterium]|nr:hypothetical protein [Patescibacteria group bacterium]
MKDETKKKSKVIWIVLGVIAALILLLTVLGIIGGYLLMRQLNISALPIGSSNSESTYDHPYLTDEQEDTLVNWGIDPSSLPTEVSQAQIDCAYQAIGADRANAILQGATPSITEALKVMPCLEK